MAGNTTKIAAQKLYCEDWHHQQQLNYYTVEEGDEVRILAQNGFRTVAISAVQQHDQFNTTCGEGVSVAEEKASRERLDRADYHHTDAVYGPLFRD